MNEQLSFFKLFEEKGYSIEIPIIQRDFAQGRVSTQEIRDTFIDALYGYLSDGTPFRDLDFIYGDVDENKCFIPLDGQQRLTTLFLLHWYLAIKDKKYKEFKKALSENGFSKFQYKTRHTSTDFCNNLLLNPIDLNQLIIDDENQNNEISKTIRDLNWFFLSWDLDPTVQGMLRMLDSIHHKFKDTDGYYDLLTDLSNPVITFQFLALSDYGLTDDLYIKMNSRGKPLTKYENFKSKFENHLENPLFDNIKYKLILEDESSKMVSTSEYFSHNIDTTWIDFFWQYKNIKEVTVDKQLMNFISVLAINHAALSQNELRKYIDIQGKIPFSFFKELNIDFTNILIKVFDFFSKTKDTFILLGDFSYLNENELFKKIINNDFRDAAYIERIQFFAYYMYIFKWGNEYPGNSKEWMRVVCNLTNNTAPYNNDMEFINSIRSLYSILDYSNDIIEYLKSEKSQELKGFNPTQIKEERIKAHLLSKVTKWQDLILNSEKHRYFKGQLISTIAFSGIETYFDQKDNLNWFENENEAYLNSFNSYSLKIFSIFDENGLKENLSSDHLLHRAILSKGDYLLYAKSNWSFLVDNDRDVSWKRLLQGDDYRQDKRKHFKELIDDERFDVADLEKLEIIAKDKKDDNPEWINKFLDHPEVFVYLGRFKYIRVSSDDCIYLLRGIKTSGEYTEIFIISLYYELIKNNFLAANSLTIKHNPSKGGPDRPFISIKNDNQIDFKIFYNGDGYFIIRTQDVGSSFVINILEEIGFFEENNFWELRSFHSNTTEMVSEIFKKIQ